MPGRIIRAAELAESRWVNGAGRKADIAAGDGWLLGFAWIDHDAPFSDYASHDRTITLVRGGGFTLSLPRGAVITVRQPLEPAAFDGTGPIACHLLAGHCIVLNAVTAYPAWSHAVQVLGPDDLGDVTAGPLVFLVVLRGRLTAGTDEAGERDTLRLTAGMPLLGSPDLRVALVTIDSAAEQEPD